jgi:3-hydroxyisobutyrate dehydrogenase-like beta-hydroxyacid dehydrogenase
MDTALGAHAAEIYQHFVQEGHSTSDFSGIINLVREQSTKN